MSKDKDGEGQFAAAKRRYASQSVGLAYDTLELDHKQPIYMTHRTAAPCISLFLTSSAGLKDPLLHCKPLKSIYFRKCWTSTLKSILKVGNLDVKGPAAYS